MELTTNYLFINLIISSFAYAYILHQLKIFLLKTGEPFANYDAEKEYNYNIYYFGPRPTNATNLGISLMTLFVFFYVLVIGFRFDFEDDISIKIFGGVLCLFILLYIISYGHRRYIDERYEKEGGYIIGDLLHFLVFEAISIAHYFSLSFDNDFDRDAFFFSQILSAVSYLLGTLILFNGRRSLYPFRILFILICLVLCMSGKFSILNWKF